MERINFTAPDGMTFLIDRIAKAERRSRSAQIVTMLYAGFKYTPQPKKKKAK